MSVSRAPIFHAVLTAALTAMPAGSARAQSASDFRLPPGAAPRAQGPADPEQPGGTAPTVSAPTSPAPAATATPTPRPDAAPVTITPPPLPRATRTAPVAAPPRARPVPAAAPTATPAPPPLPTPAVTAAAPEPSPPATPAEPVAPVGGVVIPLERHTDGIAWWWLIPSALLGAAAAWLLLKRRRPAATEWEEPPAESPAADEPAPTSPSLPQALAAPEPTPPRAPQPVSAPAAALPFELSLVPERLSVSLVNATLNYRIIVTNRSAAPLGPMAVAADMIGAHASLPEEMQLAQDGRGLELRHEVPPLGPGETAELRGDLRLPLAKVTPIRSGNATLLVPLVRLRAEAGALSLLRTIVVGETPQTEGAPLRPFRLDTGPRIFGAVSQREVAAAA